MVHLSCKTESSVITCKSHKDDIEPAKLKTFRYKDLEAATGGFSREHLLGKGSYGWVYKAKLRDGKCVAVKRSSLVINNVPQDQLGESHPLENELEILSKIRSTRLVNLVGFSRDSKETLLVVDYMPNGNLHQMLHDRSSKKSSTSSSSSSSSSLLLSWSVRLQMLLQIAKGLRALHCATPPVIHRDIKSSNVLIDSDWNARLGDFGLALRGRIEDVIRLSTPPAGTMGYLDPGYVSPVHLSTKTDVFSFGILLLEMMSGRNAIDVEYNPPGIVEWALPLIKQGRGAAICDPRTSFGNLEIHRGAMNQLAGIAARCVRVSSTRRPSMDQVVTELREVSRRLSGSSSSSALTSPLPVWTRSIVMKPMMISKGSGKVSQVEDEAPGVDKVRRRARVRMIYAQDNLESSIPLERSKSKMADFLAS